MLSCLVILIGFVDKSRRRAIYQTLITVFENYAQDHAVSVTFSAIFSILSFLSFKLDTENNARIKHTRKLKHANSILESFEYFTQMSSKLIVKILSYTVSKFAHFLRHSVQFCAI